MKGLILLLLILILVGCKSTYEYRKGDAYFKMVSVNEIETMSMKLNRTTGELELDIGGLTKTSDTAVVVEAIQNIVRDVTAITPN